MRMRALLGVGLIASFALFATGPLLGAAESAVDAIKARKDIFQSNKTAMQGIKALLDGGADLSGIVAYAGSIADGAQRVGAYFPVGSDTGDTKAKPEIWQNQADFNAILTRLQTQATQLAGAAASGDRAAAAKSFGAIAAACKSCHESYRL